MLRKLRKCVYVKEYLIRFCSLELYVQMTNSTAVNSVAATINRVAGFSVEQKITLLMIEST